MEYTEGLQAFRSDRPTYMRLLPPSCIIIGGGPSIAPEVKTLPKFLPQCFSVATNFAFKYFDTDVNTYVDPEVYTLNRTEMDKRNLVVGRWIDTVAVDPGDNLFTLRTLADPYKGYQGKNTVPNGAHSFMLVGAFSLSFVFWCYELAGETADIFLLGFDGYPKDSIVAGRPHTHFYQGQVEHTGVGKVGYYKKSDFPRLFDGYSILGLNIFNVNPGSALEQFPKITYNEMYKMLKPWQGPAAHGPVRTLLELYGAYHGTRQH